MIVLKGAVFFYICASISQIYIALLLNEQYIFHAGPYSISICKNLQSERFIIQKLSGQRNST